MLRERVRLLRVLAEAFPSPVLPAITERVMGDTFYDYLTTQEKDRCEVDWMQRYPDYALLAIRSKVDRRENTQASFNKTRYKNRDLTEHEAVLLIVQEIQRTLQAIQPAELVIHQNYDKPHHPKNVMPFIRASNASNPAKDSSAREQYVDVELVRSLLQMNLM